MADLADVMIFYAKTGWETDKATGLVRPSAQLLADQGGMMTDYMHPAKVVVPSPIFQSAVMMSIAEVGEAMRDICLAANSPLSEARVMTIGQACIALQKAEHRLRSVNRS
jgi:hypothetical protein